MSEFESLLAEYVHGNVSAETVRNWLANTLAEGGNRAELLDQLVAVENVLPVEVAAQLRSLILEAGDLPPAPKDDAEDGGEFELDFAPENTQQTAMDDPDRTVVDPEPAFDFDFEGLELLPLDGEDTEEETQEQPAAKADDATLVLPRNFTPATGHEQPEDDGRTQVLPREDLPLTEAEATAGFDDDMPTQRASDATYPSAATGTPTGTGWPTGIGGEPSQEPRSIGPGTILKDRFELLSAIGEGGMGKVYKARDLLKVEAKDRNPYIAVKLLSGDFREHPEAFIALQRESSKAQKLAHPNITTVYDFDRDGSTVYITMELMEGEELARYIKKLPPGGLPAEEALAIVRQLCDGLEYAHARNLVHSDFKPGNCFYLRDGTVKILDFGIARASTTRSDASGETTVFDPAQLGALTPAYATPEMFEGQEPHPSDDIYALACVTYELLTGKHPFNKLSSVKAMEKGLTPAPINKPGFTRRQQKALFKALAFRREDRTQTIAEFREGIRYKKNRLPFYIAGAVAAMLVLGGLAWRPVVELVEDRQTAEIIADLQEGSASVPEVLAGLETLSERQRRNLLEQGRELFIGHYQQRAEALVDESRERYNFPAAFKEIAAIRTYYPDSAQVQTLENNLRDRQAQLISYLNERFTSLLEEGRLLPVEGEEDIMDVLARIRQAAPESALLHDARLASRYAALASAAMEKDDLELAARYIAAGLEYAPQDASLLNLDDQVSRELQQRADDREVQSIQSRLAQHGNALYSIEGYAAAADDLIRLAELRPDGARLAEVLKRLRPEVRSHIEALAGEGRFVQAEQTLQRFAQLYSVSELSEMREALSRSEILAGYQPESLAATLAQLEKQRETLNGLLANPAFDRAWDIALAAEFRRTLAMLRPGNLWFEPLQQRIVDAYLDHARELMGDNRFDAAARTLETALTFEPRPELIEREHERLAEAQQAFERAQEETLRLARIEALKNTLAAQANANEVIPAARTLQTLREELPPHDAFVVTTGPRLIAESYMRLAESQAQRGNFSGAMEFAGRGLELAPDFEPLAAAARNYAPRAEREKLLQAAANATAATVGQLPAKLREVQQALPDDAEAIRRDMLGQLVERIRRLEAGDVAAAHELLNAARRAFADEPQLQQITLRDPPKPSAHVPRGREAMNANRLTAAAEILATARREEPGHEQVAAFARELEERQQRAGEYFRYYRQLMQQGDRNQARPYIEQALALWTDNPQYRQEFDREFGITQAPARAADGSRPCTAALAGYGRSGRAVCYDMLGETRGPELVVVPGNDLFPDGFAIGKYEVSIGEFSVWCRTSGECQPPAGDASLPVTGVSAAQMQAYADWLSATTGARYRLPMDAEWLHAARADDPDAVRDFNCRVTRGGQVIKGIALLETRSGRPNPWGIVNHGGNAQELVRTANGFAARGGSWLDSLSQCGLALSRAHDGSADEQTGFRLVRNLD